MKKRNWIYLVLIALCIGVWAAYWAIDQMGTDHRAPEIITSADAPAVSVLEPASAFLQGVTATDNVDGDVTGSLVVESVKLLDTDGTVELTYAAFDAAGNVAKVRQQAKYTDYESPRFSLNQTLAFSQNTNVDLFQYIAATDKVEGDISHRIRITSLDQNSLSAPGTYDVELRVNNSLGDSVKLIVPVEIYQAGSYGATVELTDYLVYLPVGADFYAKNYLSAFIRSGNRVSLRNHIPSEYSLHVIGEVDTDTPGVYQVAYRVTELPQNSSAKSVVGYSKLIVVVEG